MAKIKLKDKTELNIQTGATTDTIAVVTADLSVVQNYVGKLTKENLERAEVFEDEALKPSLILRNKYLSSFDGMKVDGTENYIVCFRLADVFTMEERLSLLEAENEALKESQEIQNGAIAELGEAVAAVPAV